MPYIASATIVVSVVLIGFLALGFGGGLGVDSFEVELTLDVVELETLLLTMFL